MIDVYQQLEVHDETGELIEMSKIVAEYFDVAKFSRISIRIKRVQDEKSVMK